MKRILEPVKTTAPKRLRQLKANERVTNGDYVEDGNRGFKLWEGILGFQADSFVDPIYRRTRAT